MVFGDYPRVVGSRPGPQTAPGVGNILVCGDGSRYQLVSSSEADLIRQGTGGYVRTLHPDGTIR
jgi:hypothetical protein